jgi:hypothetical protein
MTETSIHSEKIVRRFQFRLATLFVVTTAVCAHFALAAWDLEVTATLVVVFTLPIVSISTARRVFAASPSLAAAWAALITSVGTAILCLVANHLLNGRIPLIGVVVFGALLGFAYSTPAIAGYALLIWLRKQLWAHGPSP